MGIDNDKLLPDEKTRHWMIAQTHILMQEGAEEELENHSRVQELYNPDGLHTKF